MDKTGNRKDEHLDICLTEEVDFSHLSGNGFNQLQFDHDALPEIDKKDIRLETRIFGCHLSAPLIIGAMTGGTDRAKKINQNLALAAEICQVGLGLGSQRKMLEDPSVQSSYCVREVAPDLPLLIGNIGAVQLNYGVGVSQLRELIQVTQCDAFTFHLNPLQEAIQEEGDTNFSNLLSKLKEIIPNLGVPVLVKEVGSGISETTALKLKTLPLSGVETAGCGGTSWAQVESLRTKDSIQKSTGELFAHWGVSTAESISTCRKNLPDLTLIGSGGIRDGIEVAKALSLGADVVAMAHPFLKAAEESSDAVVRVINRVKEELRTVMFVTGSRDIRELKEKKLRKLC